MTGSVSPKRSLFVALSLWLVVYAGFISLYNVTYTAVSPVLIHRLQIIPATTLLRMLTPSAGVTNTATSIRSLRHEIVLMRGCDGVEAWLLLLSALLVFPMGLAKKAAGILVGSAVIFGLNVVRLVALFWVVMRRPAWFEVAHGLVWQTIMVLAVMVFVFYWMGAGSPAAKNEAAS